MATSKTLTPTNVTIQIPDFTDSPDQRVNSNCIDKEADAINALNSAKTTRLTESNVTSDTSILSLANGNYMVAGSTAIVSYIPERYGTLVVNKTGDNYGNYTFVATSGRTYTRQKASASTWHGDWQELARALNHTYMTTISLTNGTAYNYTYKGEGWFLLIITRANSTNTGYNGLYVGQTNSSGSISAIVESSACTVSISGRVLTLTASQNYVSATIICGDDQS